MPEPGQTGGPHADWIIPVYGLAGWLVARSFRLTPAETVLLFIGWEVAENKILRHWMPWPREDTLRDSTLETIAALIGALIAQEDANGRLGSQDHR